VHALQHTLLYHAAEVLIGKQAVEDFFVLVAALQQAVPIHITEAELEFCDFI